MKPSEEIKQKYGFTTMKEVSDKSGEHSNNLISWHKLYPRRFELVMKGLVFERVLRQMQEVESMKGLVFERVLRQMQEVESCHDDQ